VRVFVTSTKGPDIASETVDLSLGGVCIATPKEVEHGTTVKVIFENVGPTKGLEVLGRIAWCAAAASGNGFEAGIELLGLSPDMHERLLGLVSDEGWDPGSEADRRYVHLEKHLVIAYRRSGSWLSLTRHHGRSEQASLRGLVACLEESLPAGTKLNMHLLLPDGQPEPLECFGSVVETHQGHRATEWFSTIAIEELAEEARSRLAAFLSRELLPK